MKVTHSYPNPHSKYRHIHAVVRIDTPVNQQQPEMSFTIVKAYFDQSAAEDEAERLNEVNKGKRCYYIPTLTRLVDMP